MFHKLKIQLVFAPYISVYSWYTTGEMKMNNNHNKKMEEHEKIMEEVQKILEECRQIRTEILEIQEETRRKMDETDRFLLSLLKRSELSHGS